MDPLLQSGRFVCVAFSFYFFFPISFFQNRKLPLYTTTTIIKNRRAFSPLVRNHTPVRWMEAKEGGDVCRRVDTVSLDFQCFRNEIDDKRSQKRDLY